MTKSANGIGEKNGVLAVSPWTVYPNGLWRAVTSSLSVKGVPVTTRVSLPDHFDLSVEIGMESCSPPRTDAIAISRSGVMPIR